MIIKIQKIKNWMTSITLKNSRNFDLFSFAKKSRGRLIHVLHHLGAPVSDLMKQ